LLVVDRLVPERMETLAVAMIEPNGKGVDVQNRWYPLRPGPGGAWAQP
jgi:hypothetical protein